VDIEGFELIRGLVERRKPSDGLSWNDAKSGWTEEHLQLSYSQFIEAVQEMYGKETFDIAESKMALTHLPIIGALFDRWGFGYQWDCMLGWEFTKRVIVEGELDEEHKTTWFREELMRMLRESYD
jgi:hypothetical protein